MKAAYIPVGASGHILASLPMVSALVRKGAEITYFAPEQHRAQIEATGARFVSMPAVAAKAGSVSGGHDFIASLPLVFLSEADGVIGSIMPELEHVKPDVLLVDELAIAGRLAAKKLGIPLVMVFTSFAPSKRFSICRDWPIYPDTHPARVAAAGLANKFAKEYGVPAYDIYGIFETVGDFNVSVLTREFQPEGDTFGDNFCFAGPQIAHRAGGDWTPPPGDAPLLYTSLGSLFNYWPEFYQMLFAVVRELPIRILCSLGKTLKPDDFINVPENVTLTPFVPQLDVLSHASFFITHAGTGSAMEAMYFGVPCICLPQMEEQWTTASRMAQLGLSIGTLRRETLTEPLLREALTSLIANREMQERSRLLGEQLRSVNGAEIAANAIWDYAAKL